MGYPLTGIEGTVTSWGTAADDCYHAVNTGSAPKAIKLTISGEAINKTGAGDTAMAYRAGMRSWTGTIESWFPRTSRKIGAEGLVTFASGYVVNCNEWTLRADFGALDITRFGQSDLTWREFRPRKIGTFTGTFAGYVDSGTALVMPIAYSASSAAATLKLTEEGATDNQFTANIVAQQLDLNADMNGDALQTYSYQFTVDGGLTSVGAANIVPAGAVDTPDWDNNGDGTGDRTLVVTLSSGRTLTGAAFLRGWSVRCAFSEMIQVTYEVQGTGVLTPA